MTAPHDGAREVALLAFWNAINYFADSHPRIVIGNEMRVRAVEAVDSTLAALIAERVEAAVAEEREKAWNECADFVENIVFYSLTSSAQAFVVRAIRLNADRSRAPSATERGGGDG